MIEARRLHPATLTALPAEVRTPTFDRIRLRGGIVHLGLGAFMRAHLAAVNDDALEAGEPLDWGIVGVSLRHADTRDALAPQDGLYTLALRDARGERLRVIGGLIECLVAPENPGAVLDRIAHADTRIVSLTVTEKGYCHDPASGALLWSHADIAHDLASPDTPQSAIGCIVRGLALRRARGLSPITLMSLDNLPANGHTLRRLVQSFAQQVDAGLADWIENGCTFPNSMVDRIVPRTTEADRAAVSQAIGLNDAWPVVGETFIDWVVEDRFAAGRPDWTTGGTRFVRDAAPWERLKLRMVNGAHSSIAYLAAAAGWPTVDAAIAQPALRRHIDALMRDEIEPTLGPLPGLDLPAYRAQLIERLRNPALAHRTLQIAMDGSQKLPQRLLDTVRDRLAQSASIDRLALGIAAWLTHLRGHDDAGRAVPLDDPQAAALRALRTQAMAQPHWRARAEAFTRYAPVFADLAGHEALVAALGPALSELHERGAARTLANRLA